MRALYAVQLRGMPPERHRQILHLDVGVDAHDPEVCARRRFHVQHYATCCSVLSISRTKVTHYATFGVRVRDVQKPKPPQSAWLIRHRKERGWKPADVAQRLDVAEVTVRGWESGRSIRADTLAQMERLFGEEAPGHETTAPEGTVALIQAMTRAMEAQADAFNAMAEQIQAAVALSMGEREGLLSAISDLRRELEAVRSSASSGAGNARRRPA